MTQAERSGRFRSGLRLGESVVEFTSGVSETVPIVELLDGGVLKVGRKHAQRDARGRAVGAGEYEITHYAPGAWTAVSSTTRVSISGA